MLLNGDAHASTPSIHDAPCPRYRTIFCVMMLRRAALSLQFSLSIALVASFLVVLSMFATSEARACGQSEFQCAICSTTLVDPRVLDCQHAFCLRCLYGLAGREERVDAIVRLRCPYHCPEVTLVQGGDMAGLRRNPTISSLVAALRRALYQAGEITVCDWCIREKTPAGSPLRRDPSRDNLAASQSTDQAVNEGSKPAATAFHERPSTTFTQCQRCWSVMCPRCARDPINEHSKLCRAGSGGTRRTADGAQEPPAVVPSLDLLLPFTLDAATATLQAAAGFTALNRKAVKGVSAGRPDMVFVRCPLVDVACTPTATNGDAAAAAAAATTISVCLVPDATLPLVATALGRALERSAARVSSHHGGGASVTSRHMQLLGELSAAVLLTTSTTEYIRNRCQFVRPFVHLSADVADLVQLLAVAHTLHWMSAFDRWLIQSGSRRLLFLASLVSLNELDHSANRISTPTILGAAFLPLRKCFHADFVRSIRRDHEVITTMEGRLISALGEAGKAHQTAQALCRVVAERLASVLEQRRRGDALGSIPSPVVSAGNADATATGGAAHPVFDLVAMSGELGKRFDALCDGQRRLRSVVSVAFNEASPMFASAEAGASLATQEDTLFQLAEDARRAFHEAVPTQATCMALCLPSADAAATTSSLAALGDATTSTAAAAVYMRTLITHCDETERTLAERQSALPTDIATQLCPQLCACREQHIAAVLKFTDDLSRVHARGRDQAVHLITQSLDLLQKEAALRLKAELSGFESISEGASVALRDGHFHATAVVDPVGHAAPTSELESLRYDEDDSHGREGGTTAASTRRDAMREARERPAAGHVFCVVDAVARALAISAGITADSEGGAASDRTNGTASVTYRHTDAVSEFLAPPQPRDWLVGSEFPSPALACLPLSFVTGNRIVVPALGVSPVGSDPARGGVEDDHAGGGVPADGGSGSLHGRVIAERAIAIAASLYQEWTGTAAAASAVSSTSRNNQQRVFVIVPLYVGNMSFEHTWLNQPWPLVDKIATGVTRCAQTARSVITRTERPAAPDLGAAHAEPQRMGQRASTDVTTVVSYIVDGMSGAVHLFSPPVRGVTHAARVLGNGMRSYHTFIALNALVTCPLVLAATVRLFL
mgnify:CR=1 FL=1